MRVNIISDSINKILKVAKFLTLPYCIRFIKGHYYLNESQILKIKSVLKTNDNNAIVDEYEKRFTELIGSGYGISFAAGRMAFYSALKALNIGVNDEVILLGFTCSVMPNAVLRVGATPVFSDIDIETFGSDADDIEKKITPHTKLIVVQHSFGIPCKIREIARLAKKYGIFMIEDCAITLDSSIEGIKVGNWGDAAIFSTSHNKPLNTLIGGFIYTRDQSFYRKIREIHKNSPYLDRRRQQLLYKQFQFERKNYTPLDYPFKIFTHSIKRKFAFKDGKYIFLMEDYKRPNFYLNTSYPYPAKLPSFLAQLGIFELGRWDNERQRRKNLLDSYLNIIKRSSFNQYLPKAYSDDNSDIIPLRFVFAYPHIKKSIKKITKFFEENQICFKSPIIDAPDGPESLGYKFGDCPLSERIGREIINWPCVLPEGSDSKILDIFQKSINDSQN